MAGLGFDSSSLNDTVLALPTGEGRNVQIIGLGDVLKQFNQFASDLRAGGAGPDAQIANRELRAAARKIADGLEAKIKSSSGPAPQTGAVRQTARARNDRTVKVAIPGVNVRFSSDSLNGKRAGAVAFGANYGPAGGTNYYGVPRNTGGYFVEPAVAGEMQPAQHDYETAVIQIMRKYGLI